MGFLLAVLVEADVVKHEFAETVKGDAFHETGGDDAVGVEIVAWDRDGGSGDGEDFFEGHRMQN
jgi:hypothetical protein